MEEGSLTDAKTVTADTFSHASSAQRENVNAIFTSEKLEKLDELVESVKNLTINDTKYYDSSTVPASDSQGGLTSDPETVTHTSNRVFEQKILIFRTISVLPPPTNPGIAEIVLTSPTLLTPATKEVVADAASGGAWKSRNMQKVSRTGVDGRTSGRIDNVVGIVETSSPDMIGIIGTAPPCGLDLSH